MNNQLTSLSKFLSLVLRHQPEVIGLTLDNQGWAVIDDLIARANQQGKHLTRPLIEEIVRSNEKQRFALSTDGTRIRANQGHSVTVDLALSPQAPPEILYHGTATRFIASIRQQGLLPGSRQHVHLSKEEAVAINVGQRHGKPVVLRVRAGEMWRNGLAFFCSENGVWLTVTVPTMYIDFPL